MTTVDREKQIAQAEEILGDRLEKASFAKALFFGRALEGKLNWPHPAADPAANRLVEELRHYCQEHIDPVRIDREAEIPADVIAGLGRLGVLGACVPVDCGGLGMSQTSYCRLVEVLGGHCASTALFVNAHHSIGPRAIVLFGTEEQQRRYLPKLASGEWISAFALTEPEAGSDAANVQTRAEPTEDGRGYILNGQKRWITNGGIAQVLTVMARTPVEGTSESKITAFLVTPDMPGFRVVEARMPKCGVRGTATSRLAFENMFVPRENVLGQLGKGLKVALTVLDYGRVTFGASCTGAARLCLERAKGHAQDRVQFGETLASFELVKDKLAFMAASIFAMESATYQTAAVMDSGSDDYMLETAMLKVFATECLWRIVNDTIQIFGGQAYFTDEPYERMMRDARINMIGEGANDVLRVFVALTGMRDVGLELKSVLDALQSPAGNLRKLGGFAARRLGSLLTTPTITVRNSELTEDAAAVARLVASLGRQVERLLATHREGIMDRQGRLGRLADAATEIYVSCCVVSRLDYLLSARHGHGATAHAAETDGDHSHEGHSHDAHSTDKHGHGSVPHDSHANGHHDSHASPSDAAANMDSDHDRDLAIGRYYLATAARRIRRNFADLWDNDDDATVAAADVVLRGP
jgi:alkylation response protein AidB-like acyl-CoA dehydrogenase